MLKFNDGMSFETTGKLRTVYKSDGLYVVGAGMLIPVKDEKEATEIIKRMQRRTENGKA